MKYHEITCSESFPNNLVVAEFPASFPHPLEMSLGQLLIAVVEMQSLEAEFLHMAHVGILSNSFSFAKLPYHLRPCLTSPGLFSLDKAR